MSTENTSAGFSELKKAKTIWPAIIDEKFLSKFVSDGLITEEEKRKLLED